MITFIIIGITLTVSIIAFGNDSLKSKLTFNPYAIVRKSEYYRFFTHSLIHADWSHLIINLFVLFFFGSVCEQYLALYFPASPGLTFIELYIGGMIFSSIYSLIKHRNNPYYNALGASGSVMAVVFTTIFFDPWSKIYLFGLIPIPGIVFGALYLIYSYTEGRKHRDNIGHDAHLFGAIFGFLFPIILDFNLLNEFIDKLTSIL